MLGPRLVHVRITRLARCRESAWSGGGIEQLHGSARIENRRFESTDQRNRTFR